jgi:thioredoxin-like negative regulator of GroEL
VSTTSQRPERVAPDDEHEKPKLVFAYSARSGRSRQVDAFLAQTLQRRHNHDTFHLVRLDIDKRPVLAERLGVTNVPALLVIEKRRVIARLADPKNRTAIAELLSPWLK